MVFTALAAGALLVAPAVSSAEVDPNSITTDAEIVAEGRDGGGESSDRDRSGRIGFAQFLRTVNALDRNSDSGRVGRANVTQDTEVVEDGDDVLGLNSSGTAIASFTDPDPNDGFAPSAEGISRLVFGFDVVDEPVDYVLTGSIAVSVPADNSCASANLSGALGSASALSCPGGPVSVPVDLTGTLDPGTHELEIRLGAEAFGDISEATSATATADYDLELRFCTVVVEEPGEAALGTSGDDVICGRSGNEQLLGVGGNDIMFGFEGDDNIDAAGGDDEIFGGEGNDTRLYGGPGNDVIDAGPGDDGQGALVEGDVVAGGPGNDEIEGGPGNDQILGRCAEDLVGTPSPVCPDDPPVQGEDDDDNLSGGLGDDFLRGDAGVNLIEGGKGSDTASAGDLGDTLLMGGGSDAAVGGAGNDRIEGGPGNDDLPVGGVGGGLFGDAGNDCIIGGSGKDIIDGEAGNDKLPEKDGSKDKVKGGPGPDKGLFDPSDIVSSVTLRNLQGGC
jgi:Ca2+-binding RTX toxin-like protein